MSLLPSFQLSLTEFWLLRSPYHYMLIITPANLFCSMHTQMNINAMEDDSRVCVPHEHTQTDADRRQKLEQHERTKMNMHTLLRALCAPPSETTEPPLQVHGGRKKLDMSRTHTRANAHSAPFPDTLSQQQKDRKRKESVLSEINREIIP